MKTRNASLSRNNVLHWLTDSLLSSQEDPKMKKPAQLFVAERASRICLQVVAGLLQPSLGYWLKAAGDRVELSRFDDRSGHFEGHNSVRSSQANDLQIRLLNAVLMGRLVLPTLGVLVSNVFRIRVAFLTAYLTDLSHTLSPSREVGTQAEIILGNLV